MISISKSESGHKKEYPYWHCPVFACPYRTGYAKNLGQHLKIVHQWTDESIQRELDRFFECARNEIDMICFKDSMDPTRPKGGDKQ